MKLSIITINYNNLPGLKRTYESVVSQTYKAIEWIVIDGGSTDGSKEFIEKHQEHFNYWCSEPDKGIYNAMNKGICQAHGEYLQFLNSGDNLVDNKVIEDFHNLSCNEDIISGDIILDNDPNEIRCNPDETALDLDVFLNGSVTHPPTFIKKELFVQYGMYDEHLKIVSDWKFLLNALIFNNCSYRHWRRVVANFYTDGICSSLESRQIHMAERNLVLHNIKRVKRSLEKRDKKIQELDLPIMIIFKHKLTDKIKKIFRFN